MPCTLPTAAIVLYNQEESSPSVRLTAPWSDGGKGKYAGKRALVLGGSSSIGQYGTLHAPSHLCIGLTLNTLQVIQFARLSGFSPIIATASPRHSDYLKTLGASHVVDRSLPSEALQAEVIRISGDPFDLVYDAISSADTQTIGYTLTAPTGDFIVVSPPIPLGGDDVPKKKVHMARGLLALPGNEVIGASLLAALPKALEMGDIKVRVCLQLPLWFLV